MGPWRTPALTGYPCEEFLSRTTQSCLLVWKHKLRPNLIFTKKNSMPNIVKCLGYIKCYNWRSPRSIKSPSNSRRYNCLKVYIWMKRPKTLLEIREKDLISRSDEQAYNLQVFQRLFKVFWKPPPIAKWKSSSSYFSYFKKFHPSPLKYKLLQLTCCYWSLVVGFASKTKPPSQSFSNS